MSRWRPSVTVAAVIERGGKFLFVEEQANGRRVLNQPAGHLDPGESLLQAVVRETLEETACPFEPDALVGIYLATTARPGAEPVTYLRFAFAGCAGEPLNGRALDRGIVRTLWLTPGEVRASVARHRSPLVLRCMEDHLAGRRSSLDLLATDPSLYTFSAS